MPRRVAGVEDAVAILADSAGEGRGAAQRHTESAAPPGPAFLVAISGIDASGKGVIAARLAAGLERAGLNVALIGLDPWHQPARVRFAEEDPGGHFFRNAFRFEELFGRLVGPLRRDRAIELETPLLDLATEAFRPHAYRFEDVDVILLEGIFLLRRDLRPRYDASLWIECPFEVALERALRRNQEGQPEARLRADYERIYFPAQRLHLALDAPAAHADLVLDNG